MCTSLLPCPLCTIPRFNDLESLRIGLIKVATENLPCPICSDVLMGLDKLTIHLFSHCEKDIFKAENSQTDDKQSIEKSFQPVNSPSNNNDEEIFQNDVIPSKRKTKNKTNNRVSNDETNDNKNNANSEQLMKVFNMNTIPFIGIPENISTSQKNKKNVKTEKSKNGKDGKLSEKCEICGFYFLGKNILEMHKKLIHNVQNSEIVNGVSKYCCHICSKVFKMRGSLMVHLRMVHFGIIPSMEREEESPTSSLRASNTNSNCDTLEYDITVNRDIHSEGVKHDFEALIAVNRTSETQDQSNGNTASTVNTALKQWSCDICKKQFTTKYFLKKHKRLHTGEMPYACTQCNKSFTFQQSYHKHLLYHNDDKPHVCTHCGRAFKELSTLHNHQRIHTGEKPFSCETCGKCFRQRVSYLVHRRIHTGVMPYKCTSCDKSFRYKVSQRTHKCTAQPPGTLVRQSGDLVQKLIKNHKELESSTNETINEYADHENTEDSKYCNNLDFKNEINNDIDDTFTSQESRYVDNVSQNAHHFDNDLCCDAEINLKDERRDEKCIIDELVNESLLKMDFSQSVPSTSHDFNSAVTDLYSMISPPHLEMEDSLPSPSDKFKNMKLSSPENMLEGLEKQDGYHNKIDAAHIFQVSDDFESINSCFVNNRNCDQIDVNDGFHEPSFQRR